MGSTSESGSREQFQTTALMKDGGASIVVSLESALRERDRRTIYWVALVSLPLFLIGALAILFVGQWTVLKLALLLSMPLGFAVSVWIWGTTRVPGTTVRSIHRSLFVVGAIPVALNLVHYGVFSPAVLVVFIFVYVASAHSPLVGIASYIFFAVLHLVASMVFVGGIVDDPGLVLLRVDGAEAFVGEAMVQSFLLAGVLIGNANRNSSIQLLRELHDANLAAARRDVVAQEIGARLKAIQAPDGPGQLSGLKFGAFRLGPLLGRGGMGEVYRAHDEESKEAAAVKVLRPGTTLSSIVLERFRRESAALRKLRHPNIVEFKGAGMAESAGLPFVAMELLDGEDLSERLHRTGTLPLGKCLELAIQIAAGLDHAREMGIVHRDLKPSNLFFHQPQQCWKLLDFGIAKSDDLDTLTEGYVLGTPAYMSPEHALGKRVDHRSDVFALSSILYRALTGFPAFSGANVPSLLHSVAYEYPDRPSVWLDSDHDVDLVLAIGFSKDPQQRFQTAGELAGALAMVHEDGLSSSLRRRGEDELSLWSKESAREAQPLDERGGD